MTKPYQYKLDEVLKLIDTMCLNPGPVKKEVKSLVYFAYLTGKVPERQNEEVEYGG